MHRIFVIGLAVLAVTTAEEVKLDGEEQGFVRPASAGVNARQKSIDSDFPGGWGQGGSRPENVKLKADQNRVNMALVKNREQGVAGANNGFAQAIAPNRGDDRASGSLIKNGAGGPVLGGIVNAGDKRGIMRNREDGDDQVAEFQTGDKRIDTNVNSYDANNVGPTKFNANYTKNGQPQRFQVDPNSQSSNSGAGTIGVNKGSGQSKYNYEFNDSNGRATSKLEDQAGNADPVFKNRAASYFCESEENGETVCRDNNGKLVGRAISNENGDTLVYNDKNKIIGRGSARQIDGSDEKFEVVANDGLFKASTKQIVESDCFDEVLAKMPADQRDSKYRTSKVTIKNYEIIYNSQTESDGTKYFEFPDCFKIKADITIPAGTRFSQLAYELVMHVMPMGVYSCTDPGTCPSNKQCYYCDLCQRQETVDILDNTKGNECTQPISDGRTPYKIERTVCPTPEGSQYMLCNGFDRHIVGNDYYKYNGSVNAQLRVFLLPGDPEQLAADFEKQKNNFIVRNLWLGEYKIYNAQGGGNFLSNSNPADWELKAWYIEKNSKQTLVGCHQGIMDYNLGGDKVNSNQMLDWFAQVGNDKKFQLFKTSKCDGYKQQQEAYYAKQGTSGSTSGSSGGINSFLSNFNGGGGRGGLFGGLGKR